jgi:hypothetical protein
MKNIKKDPSVPEVKRNFSSEAIFRELLIQF